MSRSLSIRLLASLPLIAIVSALPAQTAPQWHATLDRTITADAAGLSQIDQMLVLPSGEIVVRQSQDGEIKFIGPAPAKAGVSFGRDGEGPGEFRNLRWIGTQAGALWAEDQELKRVTYVSPLHKLVKTIREPTVFVHGSDTVNFSIMFVQGMTPDGSLIGEALRRANQPKPSWATEQQWEGMAYFRLSPTGVILSVFAWVPANPCVIKVSINQGFTTFQIPFCAMPLSSIASDGASIVVATADQAAHTYHIWSMKPTGDTAFSKQFSYTPIAVAKTSLDSALARAKTRLDRGGSAIPAYRRPDGYPPLDHLLVGRDGTTWLGEFLSGATRKWRVLDRTGNLIGVVTLPGNVSVEVAERGQLWGVARDKDGNESIVHYTVAISPG